MATIVVKALNVRNALAGARKHLGLKLKDSRMTIQSGGEDGLYRCHLADGTIVEVITQQQATTEVIACE